MLKLDWNILFTVINLIVLLLILKKFLFSKVLGIIEQRESMINEKILNAEKKEADAERLLAHYTEKLENAKDEAQEIIEKSQFEASTYYKKTVQDAEDKAQQILLNGQKELKLQEEQLLADAKEQITILAADMAKKVASDSSSYDQFISDINGKNNDN